MLFYANYCKQLCQSIGCFEESAKSKEQKSFNLQHEKPHRNLLICLLFALLNLRLINLNLNYVWKLIELCTQTTLDYVDQTNDSNLFHFRSLNCVYC